MTVSLEKTEDLSVRCPRLGLSDDADTAFGFPSKWNYCHSAKPIAAPKLAHQRKICLSSEHTLCPVLNSEERKSLPKNLCMPKRRTRKKNLWRWLVVGMIFLFLIAGALIFSGFWSPDWMSDVFVLKAEPTLIVEIIETETPQADIQTSTPQARQENATPTEVAFVGQCAYPLEIPFGENGQFLVHQVENGENMLMLADYYETTTEAINAVNYYLPSPLWAEQIMIIPLLVEEDSAPSLKPVFVDEDDISLVKLAQDLSVSLSDLQELNQLSPFCRSFRGWLLVPVEKE